MPIECNLWPMAILTRPVGSKDRKLLIHPKDGILRAGIRRDKAGKLRIIDRKCVKIPDGIYIPEKKEQGHRHLYCRNWDSHYMYGRRLNVDHTYTDILPKLKGMQLPQLPTRTVVDMELIWPGHPDSEVTTAIKECPEELRMKGFAVPIDRGHPYFGKDSDDWYNGKKRLVELVGRENTTSSFKPLNLVGDDKYKVLEYLLQLAEEREWEGFVLKSMACKGWWKVKGVNEADVFITGFKVSTADTRKGMITGVTIGAMGDDGEVVDMGKAAGFNLGQISDMTEAYSKTPNPYLHRVIRVIYQEVAGKGKLKHGFFDGWRDDKGPESCTVDQFQ